MKHCDACGSEKASLRMGGAVLCRDCEPRIREEMESLRAGGKPVNVLHIARRIYKESHSGGNYLLRDYPAKLWERAQHHAVSSKMSMRDLLLDAVEEYLERRCRQAGPGDSHAKA